MDETMEYLPDPEDPSKTLIKQETLITVKGVPLTSYVESFLIGTITDSSLKVIISVYLPKLLRVITSVCLPTVLSM